MMKKLLLLGLAFAAGVEGAQAQKERLRAQAYGPKVPLENIQSADIYKVKPTGTTPKPNPNSNYKVQASGYGTQIGKSFYDLVTNAANGNRVARAADGTVSTVWTEHCTPGGPSFANRGVGYNYYNGTTWVEGTDGTCPDPFGVATSRQGWPEIMILPGNKEVVISHSNGMGISMTTRATKGTGAWAPTVDLAWTNNINGNTGHNGTWPRAVSSGNTIHMIYAINKTVAAGSPSEPTIDGVTNPMVYSRSLDGGLTWDRQNIFLPGMGISTPGGTEFERIGGDAYAIAANGNNVAIVCGPFGKPWTMWKSTDGGTTFTKTNMDIVTAMDTVIVDRGGGDFDTLAAAHDANHAVVIDDNGVVHALAGEIGILVTQNASGVFESTGFYIVTAAEALRYWNDTMAPNTAISIAGVEDRYPTGHANDWIALHSTNRQPYGVKGQVSMPSAATDAAGNLYVAYASVVEGASNTTDQNGQPFRDLYLIKRLPGSGAGSCSIPTNIPVTLQAFPDPACFHPFMNAAENFEESVYPTVAHQVGSDNILHMIWQSDGEPGNSLQGDSPLDPETENSIMYVGMNMLTWPFIFSTDVKDNTAYVNNISAYPNPTSGKVFVQVDLKKSANVNVVVRNIMGQEVATIAKKQIVAGSKNSGFELDMAKLAKGVYTYTVSSDNFTVTNRIVKQ